ncbi:MAG: TrkA C-terminal domain-containing protein [Nitrospirota bacterium]
MEIKKKRSCGYYRLWLNLRFRTKTGSTIIAIERNSRMHTSPAPEFCFDTGDIVFITGKGEDINKAIVYLADGEVSN